MKRKFISAALCRRLLVLALALCGSAAHAEIGLFADGMEFCGDGRIGDGQQCDDGNLADGDGCNFRCQIEFGWQCAGSPSACASSGSIAQMSFGASAGCLRNSSGLLGCFGDGGAGEVGNGLLDEVNVAVSVLDEVVAVASGRLHQCAVLSGGSVRCFGANASGQLGAAATATMARPIEVPGISGATSVDAGADHSCVIDSVGSVWCWGENGNLQLGRGTDPTDSPIPMAVSLPVGRTATALALGDQHSCALLDDASVACWGDDASGQLGDGTAGADSGTPTVVPGLSNLHQVEAGSVSTCTRTEFGIVHCFGGNGDGQLGIGGGADQPTPQLLVTLPPAKSIALGEAFACSLSTSDTLHCFGRADQFRTGTGNLIDVPSPAAVALPPASWSQIEAGARGACVLSPTLGRHCFGQSEEGQFGVGPQFQREPEVLVGAPANVQQLTISQSNYRSVLCVRDNDGNVRCSGNGTVVSSSVTTGAEGLFGPIKHHLAALTPIPMLSGVQQIELGTAFACVRLAAEVQCYGGNGSMQLGQGGAGTTPSATPLAVSGLTLVDELVTGAAFACVRIAGDVKCWGENADLQSGGGTTTDRSAPGDVAGDGDLIALTAGSAFACGLRSNGSVACWGNDSAGQLGDNDGNANDSATMLTVTGLPPGVSQVDAGQNHACALASGQVYCWGFAAYGNLGQGNELDADTALLVPGLSGITRIAVGNNFSCALDAAGAMWCWGYALDGQFGNGGQAVTGLDRHLSPVPFVFDGIIEDVVAGNSSTCIRVQGNWRCLGFVGPGSLGNDTSVSPSVPHRVRAAL
jgi:cysteine-rich repeat protein